MIRFPETIGFLPDVHTLEFVVVQQMIAAVFKFVDSVEFKVAEWAHSGLVRTDSYQFSEGEQSVSHGKILSNCSAQLLNWRD